MPRRGTWVKMGEGRLPSDRRGVRGRPSIHGMPFASRAVVLADIGDPSASANWRQYADTHREYPLVLTSLRTNPRYMLLPACSVPWRTCHASIRYLPSCHHDARQANGLCARWWRPSFTQQIARRSLRLSPKTQRQRNPFSQSCITPHSLHQIPNTHTAFSFLPFIC